MYAALASVLLLNGAACTWLSTGRTTGLQQASIGLDKHGRVAAGVQHYTHMHWAFPNF